MILNILKSEDIVFHTKTGEKLVNVEKIDLTKVVRVEGVSEYSVLQLEHKGESYLLTEEFSVEATLEALDQFIEEYDEEDEESFEFDEEEKLALTEEEVLEETVENEVASQEVKREEQLEALEQEEKIKTQKKEDEEEQKEGLESSHILWQSSSEAVGSEIVDVGETISDEPVSDNTPEIDTFNTDDTVDEYDDNEVEEIETPEEIVENEIPSRIQTETLIENSTPQSKTESATTRLSSESLALGDLSSLGITGLDDNAENIARINNILEDPDVNISSSVSALQAIVDVLIKIDAKDGQSGGTDLTEDEWELLGLNNISSPDANELNIALGNANSLDLGTTPLTNLQLMVDSLNALDQVKYGNKTGVELTDLTNLGVTGVGGAGEPTLEAVNTVLYDNDVSADHTNSVQEIVDTIKSLNSSDGTWSLNITSSELATLGITANDGSFSSDEVTYINYRIGENTPAGNGDGSYVNDMAELQALADSVDGKTIHIGHTGANTYTYVAGELYDAVAGSDILNIEAGVTVDLSAVHDFETIVLNSNNGNSDTSLGSATDKIDVRDVIDITDKSTTLTIKHNDSDSNTVERIYLDTSAFTTDGTVQSFADGGYYVYDANDGSGVSVRIEEGIIVE